MALPNFSFAPPANENPTTALHGLLGALGVRVVPATVEQTLLSHPDYPSMLSLSDALTGWQVDNTALQLKMVEQLREVPLPFVAHLNRKGGWYVVVTDLQGDRIRYHDSERGQVTMSLPAFEKQWSGVVLLAEADKPFEEPGYAAKHTQERLNQLRGPFVLVGALIVALLALLNVAPNLAAPGWLLLVSKSMGLFFSVLLASKELGNKNALTDRLCRLTAKTNCDDILNSPAAKLWGWLSWTDVGLLYFAGGLLTLLGAGSGVMPLSLLHVLALVVLPYTFFSVYYQARVAKQWCTLCLGVQGVLLAEGLLAATQLTTLPGTWQPYAALVTAFLLPAFVWASVKPLLVGRLKGYRDHSQLMALKRDPALFQALLMQQPQMPPVPDELHPIRLGNSDAGHTITMVTNPYCGPCGQMHTTLTQLLEQNHDLRADIVFLACDGSGGNVHKAARGLMALSQVMPPAVVLAEWYEKKPEDYEQWAQLPQQDLSVLDQAVAGHCAWCRVAGVDRTPMVFIDGFRLPDLYSVGALRWLVNYLPTTASTMDSVEST